MEIRKISPEFSVVPQIAPTDLRALAEAGFRSVVCNHPDGEGPDQPVCSEIERAAADHRTRFGRRLRPEGRGAGASSTAAGRRWTWPTPRTTW